MSDETHATSVDPRIEATKENPIMRPRGGVSAIDSQPTAVPKGPTLAHLIDRLERQLAYTNSIRGDFHGANDRLSGAQPMNGQSPDKPEVESFLAYAHHLVGEIHNQLVDIEAQVKRLHASMD